MLSMRPKVNNQQLGLHWHWRDRLQVTAICHRRRRSFGALNTVVVGRRGKKRRASYGEPLDFKSVNAEDGNGLILIIVP